MAISIDWGAKIINIPKADLTILSGNLYKYDVNAFRLELRNLEDDIDGMAFLKTHKHNWIVTLSGVDYARVLEIINWYTVTFEDWNYSVSLFWANHNIADVKNVNQVSLIVSNSAWLINVDQEAIQYASFGWAVNLDTNSVNSGTEYPTWNVEYPVNNMADAILIDIERGFKKILIISSFLEINEDLSDKYNIVGTSPFNKIIVNPIANVSKVEFENLSIENSELDWANVLRECEISTITSVSGLIFNCSLKWDVRLNWWILMYDSVSNVPWWGYSNIYWWAWIIIQIRWFKGSIWLNDIVDGSHSIGWAEGRLVIDSTCTWWTIHIRGEWFEVIDNSWPGCAVLDERNTGAELILLDRMSRASQKIIWTELVAYDEIWEIQKWDLKDNSQSPSNEDVFYRIKK